MLSKNDECNKKRHNIHKRKSNAAKGYLDGWIDIHRILAKEGLEYSFTKGNYRA